MPPGAGEARQQRDQPHRVAAAGRALHAVVEADRRRLHGAVLARQLADVIGRQAAFGGGALGRPLQGALAQRLEALDVACDVVLIEPAVRDQLVHQRQRERTVGARQRCQVTMALLGRLGPSRVDAPQLGAAALGLLREGPEVQVRRDRVAAPDDDQLALGVVLEMHADLAAVGHRQRLAAGAGADGAVEQRRAELVEEAQRHRLALHHPHRAGVAVRQHGLRLAGGDGAQARRDRVERLVPGDALEAAAALGADALERMQHALGAVRALGVARHLVAQRAVRRRVVGIALHAHHAAVIDRDAQRAGVGAVVRARAAHDARERVRGAGHGGTIAQCFAPRGSQGEQRDWTGFATPPESGVATRCRISQPDVRGAHSRTRRR